MTQLVAPPASEIRSGVGVGETTRLSLDGAARMAPWLVGVIPYGLIIGTVISTNSVSTLSGWLGGPLIFGGSAHISAVELMDVGAHTLVVLLTTVIVHSRLLLYSAALAPHWQGMTWQLRALAAAMIADPSYAVASEVYGEHSGRAGHLRYFGACGVLGVAWLTAITAGIVVGSKLPAGLHLEYAIPLFLVGQLVKLAKQRPARRAALVAAGGSVAFVAAPLSLGLVLGIIAGVAAGSVIQRREVS